MGCVSHACKNYILFETYTNDMYVLQIKATDGEVTILHGISLLIIEKKRRPNTNRCLKPPIDFPHS